MEDNGWQEYKKLVVSELRRCNSRLDTIETDLRHIRTELTVLKTKMYLASSIAAMVFSGIVTLIFNFIPHS